MVHDLTLAKQNAPKETFSGSWWCVEIHSGRFVARQEVIQLFDFSDSSEADLIF
jgi:hypothetical protein